MPGDAEVTQTLQDLHEEKARLEQQRQALLREKQIYRRLGFAPERINLGIRKVESSLAACDSAIKNCRSEQRQLAQRIGVSRTFESRPLT